MASGPEHGIAHVGQLQPTQEYDLALVDNTASRAIDIEILEGGAPVQASASSDPRSPTDPAPTICRSLADTDATPLSAVNPADHVAEAGNKDVIDNVAVRWPPKWLCTGWGHLCLMSYLYFANIGMWNALNTIGGLGTGDESISHSCNTTLYGTALVGGFFAGSAVNYFGQRSTAFIGSCSQTLLLVTIYVVHYHQAAHPKIYLVASSIVGGTFIGWLLASVASGLVHYPTDSQRSLFLAIASAILNLGGVIGGLLGLLMNLDQDGSHHAGAASYQEVPTFFRHFPLPGNPQIHSDSPERKLSAVAHFLRRTSTEFLGSPQSTMMQPLAAAAFITMSPRARQLIGADMPSGMSNEGGLSNASYLCLLFVCASGIFASLLVQPCERILKSDGTRPMLVKTSIAEEFEGIRKGLSELLLWFMIPLFMCSLWHEVTLFNFFNVELFDVRSRAMNAIYYYVGRILASFVFQFVCDLSTRLQARMLSAIVFTASLCVVAFTVALMTLTDVDGVRSDKDLDFVEPRSSILAIAFITYGALETVATSFSFWLIGVLPFNDPAMANRYVGWYRVASSLGGFASWLIDSTGRVSNNVQWAVSAVLWGVAITCLLLLRSRVMALESANLRSRSPTELCCAPGSMTPERQRPSHSRADSIS